MKRNIQRTKSHLTITRERLGISQDELAARLGVSRSFIALIETNRRSMPAKMLIQMAALEVQLAGYSMTENKIQLHSSELEMRVNSDYSPNAIDFRIAQCNYKATRLQDELERMVERYAKLRTSVNSFESLFKQHEQNSEHFEKSSSVFDISFYRMQHRTALLRIAKCGLQAQADLKNKIALLNAEAALMQSIHTHFNQ